MKKVGYYIYDYFCSEECGKYPGVVKKIKAQMKILSLCFDMKEYTLQLKKCRWKKGLPFGSYVYHWDDAKKVIKNADFVYFRRPLIDVGFRRFLRYLKKSNPKIKVVVEIPTYPYDREEFFYSIWRTTLYIKEVYNRNRMQGLVDKIVTYSEDETIFGIPTIRIQNGVDVDDVSIIRPKEHGKTIYLISVATLQPYHGHERIIKGLAEYYNSGGDRIVKFMIVGSGETEKNLKNLVNKKQLNKYVHFFGVKLNDELDELYRMADIGVGSFGFYKIGLDLASSLKTREYLCRGLPVVSGCRQDVFEKVECDFHYEFPNDASSIDIRKIVEFYDSLYEGKKKENVHNDIRSYAMQNVTMEKSFAPVIDYLISDQD